jgi:hypothetical protein
MPDPTLILEALAAAAVVAAVVLLVAGLPWRAPHPARAAVGGALGVGAAFFLGCRLLGARPHWPPPEAVDRLLVLLLPTVVGVEVVAAFPQVPRLLAWLLRLAIAAAAARVLLHQSVYLADLAGPGTREWTPAQAWLILSGLAAALAAVWALLALLMRRAPGRSVPLALSLVCAAAAVTVMLSGYATGGQLALPLAGALAGAAIASLALRGTPGLSGAVGVGVVGLYAVLVIGRFFGELTSTHAVLLGLAPLLCWLPELPYVRRAGSGWRGLVRVVLVAAPLVLVVVQAQQHFVEASGASATPEAGEPSIQDYENYGK